MGVLIPNMAVWMFQMVFPCLLKWIDVLDFLLTLPSSQDPSMPFQETSSFHILIFHFVTRACLSWCKSNWAIPGVMQLLRVGELVGQWFYSMYTHLCSIYFSKKSLARPGLEHQKSIDLKGSMPASSSLSFPLEVTGSYIRLCHSLPWRLILVAFIRLGKTMAL